MQLLVHGQTHCLIHAGLVVIVSGEEQSVRVPVRGLRFGFLMRLEYLISSEVRKLACRGVGWCARMSPQEGFQGQGFSAGCASDPFFACSSDLDPVLPGPGIEIRSKLGWSRRENSGRSGVWLSGVPFKGMIFFLPCRNC